MLQKIKFATNKPEELSLKFSEGKICDSQFGDPQFMFTTTDERCFFVAEKVAAKIHGLRLQPREPFEIVKAEVDYGNNRKGIEWKVNRVGFVPGEQPDGTFALPAPPASKLEADLLRSLAEVRAKQAAASVPAPATAAAAPPSAQPASYTNGNGSTNGNGKPPAASIPEQPQPLMPWALFLLGQTKQLIDVYSHSVAYASEQYGNQIKAEDVRSLMLSAFINVSKSGGVNVA